MNKNASAALERLCERFPDSKYIVSSSKNDIVPPERIERTFYRMLNNVGIPKTGTHTLRHTFASTLFEADVNIKKISAILGHASAKITLDTYIHLIEKTDHEAVKKLDDLF